MSQAAKITALYDSKCPICRIGANNFKLGCADDELELIDARVASPLKDEAMAGGYDLDRGVIIKVGDKLYYGNEAVHYMALRGARNNLFNRLVYLVFRSPILSAIAYPILRRIRLALLWMRNVPKIHEAEEVRKTSTIKKLLGDRWNDLHPNVQARFAVEPMLDEHVFYRGTMETVECSRAGKIFAHLTRFVANPLTPYAGKNVRMDVTLYRKKGLAGVYWQRTYFYAGRAPYTVVSVKRQDSKGRMTECVGAGFGMILDVAAEEGNLHFRSSRYFWQLGKVRIPLPHLLTPGETHVVHEDLRDGTFRFTISMDHLWLGRTFYQSGIFKEE